MVSMFSMTFGDGREGKFSLSLDLDDTYDSRVEMAVTGAYVGGNGGEATATFVSRLDPARGRIEIIERGETVDSVPYHAMPGLLGMPDEEDDAETLWERLRELLEQHGGRIEELLDLLPADPLLGCLVKAGLGTAIRQLIRCYLEATGDTVGETIRSVLRCLGVNSLAMIARLLARLIRCVLRAGLPIPLPPPYSRD